MLYHLCFLSPDRFNEPRARVLWKPQQSQCSECVCNARAGTHARRTNWCAEFIIPISQRRAINNLIKANITRVWALSTNTQWWFGDARTLAYICSHIFPKKWIDTNIGLFLLHRIVNRVMHCDLQYMSCVRCNGNFNYNILLILREDGICTQTITNWL